MGAAKRPTFRADPKQRPVDAVADSTEVVNPDPERSYVLVNETNRGFYDVEFYESMAENMGYEPEDGYEVVRRVEGGPRLRVGRTARGEDDIIRYRGMVLMSCPKWFKELLNDIGQKGADKQAAEVRQRRGVADDLAGIELRGRGSNTTYIRSLTGQEVEG